MKISIVGMGMGNDETITKAGERAILEADFLIGAKRLIECFPNKKGFDEIYPEKIVKIIEENGNYSNIVVLMSGDTGFYSGTKKLLPILEDYDVSVIPGISSVQYMASKIKRPWQNVRLVSAHGVKVNILGNVLKSKETFFLTGGEITPKEIIDELNYFNLGDTIVYVGENLSREDEKIKKGLAKDLTGKTFHSLSVVWIIRKDFTELNSYGGSIEDGIFARDKVPMTKMEVRGTIISKMGIKDNDIVYDIGAGTGSIGIEMALLNKTSKIYAIETNELGVSLIRENRKKFSAYNLKVIEGMAPLVMDELPKPDKAFIGGSKGNLKEIFSKLMEMNPDVKIVVSAIALETLNDAFCLFENPEVTQISVSKAKNIAGYNMMMGQNPIYIINEGETIEE